MNENQEVKNAVYHSSIRMTRDFYNELFCVTEHRQKKVSIVFLCVTVCEAATGIGTARIDCAAIGLFAAFALILFHFMNKKVKIRNYERNLISMGKEPTAFEKLCDDAIVTVSEGLEREHSYQQITKFLETKNLLLLHLQLNLYIILDKNTLNAGVEEVKAFLVEKCPLVKKKEFVDCSDAPRWNFGLMIATTVVSVIGFILACVAKANRPV